MLAVKGVSKKYQVRSRQVKALKSVDLSVAPGEFVSVIGPNGCGKSTLLKIIAGITSSSSGSIKISGQLAYLPQQPSLLPWQTIEQNLALPLQLKQTLDHASKKTIRKLLKDFDLLDFANQYPYALSGGMQQKVAILRTIITKPDLLLFDEPFSALDAITRLELQDWLLNLWQKERSAVVCVTHDIREAIFLSDTIYVFSERPGTIIKKFKVDLPRPRKREHLLTPQAKDLERQLHKMLVGSKK